MLVAAQWAKAIRMTQREPADSGLFLGIDTGGTYTDAVLWAPDHGPKGQIVAKAKALTTRHDLTVGIGGATGAVLEKAWTWFGLKGEPPMTRFLAEQLATPHWYDISAAARDFGYRPQVSLDEGFQRLAAHCRGDAPLVAEAVPEEGV